MGQCVPKNGFVVYQVLIAVMIAGWIRFMGKETNTILNFQYVAEFKVMEFILALC